MSPIPHVLLVFAGIWASMRARNHQNRVTTTHPRGRVNEVNRPREDRAEPRLMISHAKSKAQLSRQQAAERLSDVAYALTGGGRLMLDGEEEVVVPAVDRVVMTRTSKSIGDCVEIQLMLSWSTSSASGDRGDPG
jgi:hypothetical protein